MPETAAEQFEALARAATQGIAHSGKRVESAADACAFVDVRMEEPRADIAIARVVTKNNIYAHKDDEEAIANAAFIAFCFNHRAQIAAALRGGEDGWRDIETVPDKRCAAILYFPQSMHAGCVYGEDYRIAIYHWDGDGWLHQGTNHDVNEQVEVDNAPTAWRPLPPSPGAAR